MENNYMATPDDLEALIPFPLGELDAKDDKTSVDLLEYLEDKGLMLPHVKAESLIGDTFVIMGARPFESTLPGSDYCYFCTCRSDDGKEIFTTVFGGQVTVDLLNKYVESGADQAIRVKLGKVEQGKYGGYYVFEPPE